MKKLLVIILIFLIPQYAYAGAGQQIVKEWAKYKKQHEQYLRKEYKKYEQKYDKAKKEKIDKLEKEKEGKTPEQIKKINYRIYKEKGNENFKLWDEWHNDRLIYEKEQREKFRQEVGFWKYYGSKLFGKWVMYTSDSLEFWEETGESELYDDYRYRTMSKLERLFWGVSASIEKSQTTLPPVSPLPVVP